MTDADLPVSAAPPVATPTPVVAEQVDEGVEGGVDMNEMAQVAQALQRLPTEMQAVLAERERTAVQQDRADNKSDIKNLM